MIRKALTSLMLKDNTITHGAGNLIYNAGYANFQPVVGNRIYSLELPKQATAKMASGMPPSIFMYVANNANSPCHDGQVDLTHAVVRVHCVAGDPEQVQTALWALGNMLDCWFGSAGGGAAPAPIVVQRIELNNGADAYNSPLGAAEFGLAESMIELNCWYNNP